MADPKPSKEAVAAHKRASARLDEAESRWGDIRAVTSSIRDGRRRNHFAELIGAEFRKAR